MGANKQCVVITAPKAKNFLDKYPKSIFEKLYAIRELVIESAEEIEEIDQLEETLKWGELSFISKIGSTIRMDWKEKTPNQYAIYFQCTSRLVDTFRLVFDDKLQFEGKRAIIFNLNQEVPKEIVKQCIKAALCYHKVKHLETLGIH